MTSATAPARELKAATNRPNGGRLRVLLIGPYPPPWGGVQTNIVALREYLRRQSVPCAVINLTSHRRADSDDVYYPSGIVGVLRLLLRLRYEIIHLHIGGNLSTRLLLLALLCSALPWARVVLTFHSGGFATSPQGRRARALSFRGFVMRRLDRHVVVNEQMVDLFRRFGCDAATIRLIPPHAFPETMTEVAKQTALPFHIEQFVSVHSPLLVTVSGLEPEYDIPLQLDVLAGLLARHERVGLVVVGSGSLDVELRQQVSRLPHGSHVLLTGDLPHEATLGLIARADLSLRTTWYDGDAISVREALCIGTPVIATDNGMRPTGVRLVPISDRNALRHAILEHVADPRRVVSCDGVGDENVERVLALYEEMLGVRQLVADPAPST